MCKTHTDSNTINLFSFFLNVPIEPTDQSLVDCTGGEINIQPTRGNRNKPIK